MTAIEYRLAMHLAPAGEGREAPFPISVRLVAPQRYAIFCLTCGTHTPELRTVSRLPKVTFTVRLCQR